MAYVLVSATLGVFLGEVRQPFLTVWSETDANSMDEAPCFDTQEDIGLLIRSWGIQDVAFLESLRPAAVIPDIRVGGRSFASPAACAMAGLPSWLSTATEIPLPCGDHDQDAFAGEEPQRWQLPTMN
jgi:hypothetical protein